MQKYRIVFLICACLTAPAADILGQTRKPNIILIMADDLGYETLQAYGGTSYRTPRLNEMASKGMRFDNAHATPLCTPSRVQLMTGKYNFRNYIGFGLLDPAELTFAHLLKNAGYVTGITGKWQLLGLEKEQADAGNRRGSYPFEAGFDDYCLWQVEERLSRYKDPVITFRGNKTEELKGQYGPDVFARFANDFITRHRDTTFFLYYPMVLVHDPFQPVPGHADYENHDPGINDPKYFSDMITYMDKIVGGIIDKVEQLGISENTLILFIGDNGTDKDVVSIQNGRKVQGGKSGHTDNATHVPMIAYWKETIQPGTVNPNLIDFTDFVPTLCDIAEAALPRDFFTDGTSFYPQLRSVNDAPTREYVFCAYDPKRGKDRIPATWIHDKEWKLYTSGKFIHLARDREEKNPLTDEQLDARARQAKARLQKAMNEILNR